MAEKIEDGGSAFPKLTRLDNTQLQLGRDNFIARTVGGMSLRDWFAGMALQGLLANQWTRPDNAHSVVESAWRAADAMLTARGNK